MKYKNAQTPRSINIKERKNMEKETIRPMAICVCRGGERILLAEYLV